MQESPKISVIIPVYNAEKYLKECLDSILNNTLKDIEVICVDDGSTDNSLKILEEYKHLYTNISLLHTKNQGGGAARNRGLDIAKGKYLLFLDADDYFDKEMFEKLYNQLEKTNADVCVCGINKYSDRDQQLVIDRAPNLPESIRNLETFNYKDIPNDILYYFKNAAWNKMFRTSFIKEQGLKFQEIRRSNDLYFSKVALLSAKIITKVDEKLVFYRVHQKTNCQSNNYKYPYEFIKALTKLNNYIYENNYIPEIKESFKNYAISDISYNLRSLSNWPYIYIKVLRYTKNVLCPKLGIDFRLIKRKPFLKILLKIMFSIRNSKNSQEKTVITILGLTFKIRKVGICTK